MAAYDENASGYRFAGRWRKKRRNGVSPRHWPREHHDGGGRRCAPHGTSHVAGRFTTIAEVGSGGAPIINSAKIPLPNGAGAMGYQQSMLGKPTGIYNPVRNNCFGHCIKVLERSLVEIRKSLDALAHREPPEDHSSP
jgi:hypothetical protein